MAATAGIHKKRLRSMCASQNGCIRTSGLMIADHGCKSNLPLSQTVDRLCAVSDSLCCSLDPGKGKIPDTFSTGHGHHGLKQELAQTWRLAVRAPTVGQGL